MPDIPRLDIPDPMRSRRGPPGVEGTQRFPDVSSGGALLSSLFSNIARVAGKIEDRKEKERAEADAEERRVVRAAQSAQHTSAQMAEKRIRESLLDRVSEVSADEAIDADAYGDVVAEAWSSYSSSLEDLEGSIGDPALRTAFATQNPERARSFMADLADRAEERMSAAAVTVGLDHMGLADGYDEWAANLQEFESGTLENLTHLTDGERAHIRDEVISQTLGPSIQTSLEEDPVGFSQRLLENPEIARALSVGQRRAFAGEARRIQRGATQTGGMPAHIARELDNAVRPRFSETVMDRLGSITVDDLAEQDFDSLVEERGERLAEAEQLLETYAPYLDEEEDVKFSQRLLEAHKRINETEAEYRIARAADQEGRAFFPGSVSPEALDLYIRSSDDYQSLLANMRAIVAVEIPAAAAARIKQVAQGYQGLIARHSRRFGALPRLYAPEIEGMVRSGNPNLVAAAGEIHNQLTRDFRSRASSGASAELFAHLGDDARAFLDAFNEAVGAGLTPEQAMIAARESVGSGSRRRDGGSRDLAGAVIDEEVKTQWEAAVMPAAEEKWGKENLSPGLLRDLQTSFQAALDPSRGLSYGQAADHALAMVSRRWSALPSGKVMKNAPPRQVQSEAFRQGRLLEAVESMEDLDFHYVGTVPRDPSDPFAGTVNKWTVSRRLESGAFVATSMSVTDDPTDAPSGLYQAADFIAENAYADLRSAVQLAAAQDLEPGRQGLLFSFSVRHGSTISIRDAERSVFEDYRERFVEKAEAFIDLHRVPDAVASYVEKKRVRVMEKRMRIIQEAPLETTADAQDLVDHLRDFSDVMSHYVDNPDPGFFTIGEPNEPGESDASIFLRGF